MVRTETVKILLKVLRRLWAQLPSGDQKLALTQLVGIACERLYPSDLAALVLDNIATLCHKSIDKAEHHQAQTAHAISVALRNRVSAVSEMQLLDDSNRSVCVLLMHPFAASRLTAASAVWIFLLELAAIPHFWVCVERSRTSQVTQHLTLLSVQAS